MLNNEVAALQKHIMYKTAAFVVKKYIKCVNEYNDTHDQKKVMVMLKAME